MCDAPVFTESLLAINLEVIEIGCNHKPLLGCDVSVGLPTSGGMIIFLELPGKTGYQDCIDEIQEKSRHQGNN